MKKLQFTAQCTQDESSNACNLAQTQVAKLLVQRLGEYGFETLAQSDDRIAVSVDSQSLPLSITCQSENDAGQLVCEITSYPEEEQDWLDRITEQSLLNQLAQAVENTLKKDEKFRDFQWYEQP